MEDFLKNGLEIEIAEDLNMNSLCLHCTVREKLSSPTNLDRQKFFSFSLHTDLFMLMSTNVSFIAC